MKALLVGINAYEGAALRGCINDVMEMRDLLLQRYKVVGSDIRMLTDREATVDAIQAGLKWLAQLDTGETVPTRLFHFSGHGTHIADKNGDEPDGADECLVPVDYRLNGYITDDMLRAHYDRFHKDTHLLLVMDSCHSGTVQRDIDRDVMFRFLEPSPDELDRIRMAALKHVMAREEVIGKLIEERVLSLGTAAIPPHELGRHVRTWINESLVHYDKRHYGLDMVKGNVVLLAGCRADQTAADARFGTTYHGAFTYHLLRVLRQGDPLSYFDLIQKAGSGLARDRFQQFPQLECSQVNRSCHFLNIGTLISGKPVGSGRPVSGSVR